MNGMVALLTSAGGWIEPAAVVPHSVSGVHVQLPAISSEHRKRAL